MAFALEDVLRTGQEFTYAGERFMVNQYLRDRLLVTLERYESPHGGWSTIAQADETGGSQVFRMSILKNGALEPSHLEFDRHDEAILGLISLPTTALYDNI